MADVPNQHTEKHLYSQAEASISPLEIGLQKVETIRSECEKLLRGDFGSLNERQTESLRLIEKAGAGALALLPYRGDKPAASTPPAALDAQAASIRTITESSLRPIRDCALKQGVELVHNNTTTSDRIMADARLVKKALVELLNATLARTAPGATIQLNITDSPDEKYVEFSLESRAAETNQRTSDAQLATAFRQELASATSIAKLHGGALSAEFIRGQRMQLMLQLPRHSKAIEPTLPEPPTVPQQKQEITGGSLESQPNDHESPLVLLADDQPVNLKLFTNLLQHLGYRSVIARTGNEAIQLASTHRPNLILLNIQMAGLDGIEATSQIATGPQTKSIPVICVASFAMPHDRERCFAAGARAYFCKPVNLGQLSKVMADLLKTPIAGPTG